MARNRSLLIRRALLCAALATAVASAVLPQPAAAHRNGSWMYPQEVMLRIEARGFDLAMCKGRGVPRYRGDPDTSYAQFRHFECAATTRSGELRVICVHTLSRKRLQTVQKPVGHLCRF
jgi:hypothetical protein